MGNARGVTRGETMEKVLRMRAIVGAGLLSMSVPAVSGDAANRLNEYLSAIDAVGSKFEQRLFDERRNLLEQSSGTMLIDRPGRFRFEYVDPPQLIVGDGAKVWLYDPELAQVTVRDMDATLGTTPAVLLSGNAPVEEGFRVTAPDSGTGIDVFVLVPRSDDAPFGRIRLAFVGGEFRRMELVDRFGQMTVMVFDDIRRQPSIPSGAFAFTPPAGVDVIDAGE